MKRIILIALSLCFAFVVSASAQMGGQPHKAYLKKFKGHIVPKTDGTYDIGSNALRIRVGYFDSITSATIAGVSEIYGSGWNADAGVPQKNDIYDYLHIIDTDDDGDVDTIDSAFLASPGAIGGTTPAAGTFTILTANEGIFGAATRVTINDGASEDGITFGSLGTATKGIDLSSSGLSGSSDRWFYGSSNYYWEADGDIKVKDLYVSGGAVLKSGSGRTTLQGGPAGTTNDMAIRLDSTSNLLIGNDINIGFWNGDGVSNGTTTITDIGGAAHGLSLAAGDLVHIVDATTSADEGYYRIVSDDGTLVVVDRALAGSDTNLKVYFYKDLIGIFATDGTNGQRIMNYSHQDKPLQIGGDVMEATGHSLGAEDVLIGGSLLEINPATHFDSRVYLGSMTFAFTTEANITDPLTSSVVLLDGDDDGENDTVDLQDGEDVGQVAILIAHADIDANDTCAINYADTTCTGCAAVTFDTVGESSTYIWTGATWVQTVPRADL